MEKETIARFKHMLEEELRVVEDQLKKAGTQNEAGEWEATGGDIDETATESDELGDRMEEYGENRAEVDEIQIRWRNIERALDKIEEGTYGICEVGGEQIEEDRLEANASARTCKAHMEKEGSLGA
jgi:RNA polymerase-binding transcription factor DksA